MHIPFKAKSSTRYDIVAEVERKGTQRIRFEHTANGRELALGFFCIIAADELGALDDGHIGPVDSIRIVAVVGADQIIEDSPFIIGDGMDWIMMPAHVWPVGRCWGIIGHDG